jgi:hypothetical protein
MTQGVVKSAKVLVNAAQVVVRVVKLRSYLYRFFKLASRFFRFTPLAIFHGLLIKPDSFPGVPVENLRCIHDKVAVSPVILGASIHVDRYPSSNATVYDPNRLADRFVSRNDDAEKIISASDIGESEVAAQVGIGPLEL